MMMYLAGAVIVLAGLMIAWIWIYENFIKDNSASSIVKPDRSAENTSFLQGALNYGHVGEPLIMYDQSKKMQKQLQADPYRLELPVFTVSSQERGLVVGVSGSGKTNFIFAQICDWMKSGKSFVVSDVKPEIWGVLLANNMFEGFGYDYIVINPTDEKSYKYNMLDDVADDQDLDELLQILVPAVGEGSPFADFGRNVLKACIIYNREKDGDVSLTSVFKFLTSFSSGQKLLDKLLDNGSDNVKSLVNQAKMAGNSENFLGLGLTALVRALSFLNNKTIADNVASSDFSLDEALQMPRVAVFLQYEQKDMKATQSLFSAMVQHIIRVLMTNARNRDDVFLLFDELLNGGKIENLADKFNLIRSYKMPSFLYIQSIAGLVEKYNEDEAMKIISACSLQICYRVNDVESAEFFSKLAGQIKATRHNKTVSPAVNASGAIYSKPSYSQNAEMVDLVPVETMLQMPFGKALCVYKGQSAIINIPQHFKDTPMTNPAGAVRLGDLGEELEEVV